MFNRAQFIIRSLLQKSNIIKQSFINNKKIYNLSIYKNRQKGYNYIITKKIHSNSSSNILSGMNNNNNGPNLPIIICIFFASASCYLYLLNS